jgi:LmbE family N-acetylglucosaminyl deacetylase
MPPTVLTLLAHPDDAEILCGGTLLLLRDRGWRVHLASMTPGDCGSADLGPEEIAAVRRKEGAQAAALLDGEYHCLERRDLQVHYDDATVRAATTLLRRVRPDLVVTHSPADYMLDHEETSRVARAACFNAPVPNAPVDAAGPGRTSPERLGAIPHLYYADAVEGVDALGAPVEPALLVDIASVLDRKADLVACHASQREWLRRHHGIDEYIDSTKRWAQERGRDAGLSYAEGFRQHLGHAYPHTDLLGEVLGPHVRRPGGAGASDHLRRPEGASSTARRPSA